MAVCDTLTPTQSADATSLLSPRIQRLRELAFSYADDLDPSERGRAVTISYRATRLLPMVLRRAHALARALDDQTVRIFDGELIVGRCRRQVAAHAGIFEECRGREQLAWPELHGGSLTQVPDAPQELRDLYEYWETDVVSPGARLRTLLPEEEILAMSRGVYTAGGLDLVHRCANYPMLLEEGVAGVRERALRHLSELDETTPDSVRQRPFLQAVIICCDALVRYANRYAEEARRLAEQEPDAARRSELLQIAQVCSRVPEHPAQTFHEALQSVWLFHCADRLENSGSAESFGRMDQYLGPLYAADLAADRITRERALELVECFHLKCYSTFDFQHAMVGGVTPDGSDGTNEVSYLILDALEALGAPRDVAVRVHADAPPQFLHRAAQVAALGLGRPDFWNDEVTIPALTARGVPLADARDYTAIGCVEVTIPGRSNPRTMSHAMNLAKCLELALHNGCDQLTGQQVGPQTGVDFPTYRAFHAAYRAQARHFIRLAIQHNIRAFVHQSEAWPCPMHSAFTADCVTRGRDMFDGGARFNQAAVNLEGVADVANALAAIRALVFEQPLVSLDELRLALREDFAGHEPLRQRLLNTVPTYGNDDDAVDRIAAEEAGFYCDEVSRYRTPEGDQFWPLLFGTTSSSNYHFSRLTGAGANGRHMGAPLAISATPAAGTDLRGATAAARSVAKLPQHKAAGGVSYIMELHPGVLQGPAGVQVLEALIASYFAEGGMEIGFSIVGEEQLRQACREPERFRNLMVRVFGFSTQFVALKPELQEAVIARVRHRH
jgi:pyruvate formate-lyase/glycerol dehydratase family glycyl radical enzyme